MRLEKLSLLADTFDMVFNFAMPFSQIRLCLSMIAVGFLVTPTSSAQARSKRASAPATNNEPGWALSLPGNALNVNEDSRSVTLDKLKVWVDELKSSGSDFPFEANEEVLSELQRLMGSSKKHPHMYTVFERMEQERAPIESTLKKLDLPIELMAIPIIESAYRNFKSHHDPAHRKPAGLWMMVPATARHYGLHVGKKQDDRLEKDRATEAAARHLKDLYREFKDWGWAVVAYNQGEFAVKKILAKASDHDAWSLMRKGLIKNYLASVTAAALLIRKPEIIGYQFSTRPSRGLASIEEGPSAEQ